MTAEEKKDSKYTTVSIPSALAAKIKGRIEGTGFTSVSDYVTYVLREVLASLEEEDKEKPFSKEGPHRSTGEQEHIYYSGSVQAVQGYRYSVEHRQGLHRPHVAGAKGVLRYRALPCRAYRHELQVQGDLRIQGQMVKGMGLQAHSGPERRFHCLGHAPQDRGAGLLHAAEDQRPEDDY